MLLPKESFKRKMRKSADDVVSEQIASLNKEVVRLETIIQVEMANMQNLTRDLHTDMWNLLQAINASQAETVGLSVVSRLSHEMEKVRSQIGDMRQEIMRELRQPQ